MTQEELMMIRDVTGDKSIGVLWREDNESVYIVDVDGIEWEVGKWKGELVRRKWGPR